MDYSLLLGLHDCARAEQENRERAEREEEEDNHEEEDDSESGSGLDSRGPMGEYVSHSYNIRCFVEFYFQNLKYLIFILVVYGVGVALQVWQRLLNHHMLH